MLSSGLMSVFSRRCHALMLAVALSGVACSGSDHASSAAGGSGNTGTGATGNAASGGGGASSGSGGSGANGGNGLAAAAGAGAFGGASSITPPTLVAIAGSTTVGLEWDAVPGATGYRIYWSTTGTVDPATAQSFDVTSPDAVQRGLSDGTAVHYVITALGPWGESAPSAEASATPSGEWVLEEFGNGIFDSVVSDAPVPRVPIAQRVQILLFAEGYLSTDLPTFHAVATHDGARNNDVDRWIDEVFAIEPYSLFKQAFMVWILPRASANHIGEGDTAFVVPVDLTASFPATGTISSTGETATREWQALGLLPYPPTVFVNRQTRNHIASFLIFDPTRGRASVSGRTLSMTNPADTNQRIPSAFGVGHAHEFTHAFARLRDEYMEDTNSAPTNTGETSNVVASAQCSTLPWAHLLYGSAINPNTDQLVGAFGDAAHGYHSELLCLLNGTHDNATYFGGSGLLRTDTRMCNFCREITAYSVFERSSVIADDATSFATWKADYRQAFYDRYGFKVPSPVPQTNDVQNPAQGTPIFEACTP